MKVIEIIRAIIRPYIAIAVATTIIALAIVLALKFADAEMAKQIITWVLATGGAVIGFYFGERAARK